MEQEKMKRHKMLWGEFLLFYTLPKAFWSVLIICKAQNVLKPHGKLQYENVKQWVRHIACGE